MKITKNRLKQIIKEEIEALGDERGPSAEDYRQKIEGFAEALKVVENAPDELKKAMKYSVKMSVDSVLENIADDSLRDGVKKLVEALLGLEYLPDDMNESIGGLMDKVGYEKAKNAIKSAIDFDEKVEDMDDLKDLIKTLGSEKDPMGKSRDTELVDIENALKDALSNISEAMSNDRYNELVKAIRKDPNLPKDEQDELIGILNELITPTRMNVDEKFITLDVLKAIRKDPRYREGEPIDADAAGAYGIPGFLTRDDVINLADKLELKKDAEKSYLSEKLKRIIKEEIGRFLNEDDEYYSSDEYKQKQRKKDKKGVENELILGMGISEDIITDDLLNAIMAHEDYMPGESIDADATGAYGFITADEVKRLADKLELKKDAEKSYLSEKLKRSRKKRILNRKY